MKINVHEVFDGNYDDSNFESTPKAKRYENSEFVQRNELAIADDERKAVIRNERKLKNELAHISEGTEDNE
jgi:hypothetical protein